MANSFPFKILGKISSADEKRITEFFSNFSEGVYSCRQDIYWEGTNTELLKIITYLFARQTRHRH